MSLDDLRAQLENPMGYVMQLAKAQLAGDLDGINELFGLIGKVNLWPMVAMIACAELAQELHNHRGDEAEAWLNARLAHGLDL